MLYLRHVYAFLGLRTFWTDSAMASCSICFSNTSTLSSQGSALACTFKPQVTCQISLLSLSLSLSPSLSLSCQCLSL